MNNNRKRFNAIAAALLSLAVPAVSSGATDGNNDEKASRAKAYLVADAHLDTQWSWDAQTTIKSICGIQLIRIFICCRNILIMCLTSREV